MKRNILILGNHPIARDLVRQYEVKRDYVTHNTKMSVEGIDFETFDELCLLTSPTKDYRMKEDDKAFSILRQIAQNLKVTKHDGLRLKCHLLLQSQTTLWLLQTLDIYKDITKRIELYPFTLADQWAKNVFCRLPKSPGAFKPLDRVPIKPDSNKTVHLLIVGTGEMAECLALHAALIAHFPNYTRNHSLRTRITLLDTNIHTLQDTFIDRYKNLFDHSYYRSIKLGESKVLTNFHRPKYCNEREDFVDIEWEFVDGSIHDPVMQDKLRIWSFDQDQVLTIAFCSDDTEHNIDEALTLPSFIHSQDIPLLVYVHHSGIFHEVCAADVFQNIYPFGMEDEGYDIDLPLLQMAKRLHYFYMCSYGQKGTPTELPIDEIEEEWNKIESFNIRYSNINGVMTIATKMRSLGHDESDWDKFYALTQDEIELLSSVEHNRWSVERLIMGFCPPTAKEREQIRSNIDEWISAVRSGGDKPKEYLKDVYKKKKVHLDLCAYRELGTDKTGQNVRVYDYDLTACIPLIANSFNEQLT